MRIIGIVMLIFLLSSCSSKVVRCDGKLSPINAPAPAAADVGSSTKELAP